jgi:CHAT domain-containing protein/Tfp pilus assembly protein PilF
MIVGRQHCGRNLLAIGFLNAGILLALPGGSIDLIRGIQRNDFTVGSPAQKGNGSRKRIDSGTLEKHSKQTRKVAGPTPQCDTAEADLAEANQLRNQWSVTALRGAVQKYTQARACWHISGKRVEEANLLQRIGETYYQLSEYQSARDAYQQALLLWEDLGDQRSKARSLSDLSLASLYLGDTDEARRESEEAISLSQRLADNLNLAHALNSSGKRYLLLGQPEKALTQFQQALALSRGSSDRWETAQSTLNIGHVHADGGALDKAVETYLEALPLWEAVNYPWGQAKTLTALARAYTALGENQEALDSNQKALELSQRIGDRAGVAAALNNAGYAYASLGQGDVALERYLKALSIFQEISSLMGQIITLKYVGNVCASTGRDTEAQKYYQQALHLISTLHPPPVFMRADVLNDLGLLYCSLGKAETALQSFRESLRIFENANDWRGLAVTLNNMGVYYRTQGRILTAHKYHQRALGYMHQVHDREGEILTLYYIANMESLLRRIDDARAHIDESIKLIESSRTKLANRALQSSYGASVHQLYQLYIEILMQLHKERPNSGYEVKGFEISERARARSLLDSLRETGTNIREGVDSALLEKERSLQQRLNAKAERRMSLANQTNSVEADAVAREIDQLTTEYEETEAQIRSTSPRYAALTQPKPLSLPEIQQQVLDDNSLLLEYMLGDDRSYVWAITRGKVDSFELPGRARIEEASRRFYGLLTAHQPISGETFEQRQARITEAEAHIAEEAESLSKLVLGPVRDRLGKMRLLIVPDGALQYIPFQALVVPPTATPSNSTGQWQTSEQIPLIFDHEIINEPSASALALVMSDAIRRRPAPKTITVFADPVFDADDPRVKASRSAGTQANAASPQTEVRQAFRDVGFGEGMRIPPLPASREEAEAIMAVVPWHSGFKAMGFEASPATILRTNLGQYRIVHFATHGFVDYQRPELSGLVLSMVDEKGNPQDGFLRMHDIYNLKLPVDLVVLSACNTALGKDVKGEGLIGLTRGFMYAGAKGVVASLWKVDDDATAELMAHFYEGMFKKDLSSAAALREAQLTMWRQKRWHAPYYWAAFVIQGQYNQREMSASKLTNLEMLGLAGGISALSVTAFLFLWRRRRKTR